MGLATEPSVYPLAKEVHKPYGKYLRKKRIHLMLLSLEFIIYVGLFLVVFLQGIINRHTVVQIRIGNNDTVSLVWSYLFIAVLFICWFTKVVLRFSKRLPWLKDWEGGVEKEEFERLKASVLYSRKYKWQ